MHQASPVRRSATTVGDGDKSWGLFADRRQPAVHPTAGRGARWRNEPGADQLGAPLRHRRQHAEGMNECGSDGEGRCPQRELHAGDAKSPIAGIKSSWASCPAVVGVRGAGSAPRTSGPADAGPMPFAFYGRMSTTGYQDPASSRRWQYDNATRLVAGYGVIVPEFFDPGFSPVNSRSVNYPRQFEHPVTTADEEGLGEVTPPEGSASSRVPISGRYRNPHHIHPRNE
jgi:hypothetical protein